MNDVNKTLYIPLYGKSYVSKRGLFIDDKKAEEIWKAEGFALRGKSKSKWLAYYMGIRSAVFDQWIKQQLEKAQDTVVLHIGCGMDSRVLRVGTNGCMWYDVDFPDVIMARKKYFSESADYRMLAGDARDCCWLQEIPETGKAIVIMEGVSMYLTSSDLRALFDKLGGHFAQVSLLLDCYSVMAAKMSKYKNPINDVGVTRVYGIDDPKLLQCDALTFVKEHTMIPKKYIDELHGAEKRIFEKLYAGRFSQKLYRLFEYKKI